MVFSRFATAVVLASGVLAGSLSAQEKKLQLAAFGGLASPMAELGQVGYPDGAGGLLYRKFKGGVNFGANATYWVDTNLGLRVDGTYAGAKVVEPFRAAAAGSPLELLHETSWTKMFLSVDLVLRAAGDGLKPYAYFGGGVAKMSESGGRKASRPTANVGAGLKFTPANGMLGFFAEGGLFVYDFDQTKFTFYDKVQEDLSIRAGISIGL